MTLDASLVVLFCLVAGSVLLFEMSMFGSFYGDEARRKGKLKKHLERLKHDVKEELESSLLREDIEAGSLAHRIRFLAPLKLLLIQAGHRLSVERFVILSVFIGVVAGWSAWTLSRLPGAGVAFAIIGVLVPYLILKKQQQTRLNKFNTYLPEALDITVRALKAGHPLDMTMRLISEELPSPISEEFAITFAEISYGVTLKTALHNLLLRMPSQPLKVYVTVILVQRDTGGNLAEILGNISYVVRGGFKLQRRIKTLSAEGRLSAVIMACLPIAIALGMYLIRPDLVMLLIDTPSGHLLILFSLVSFIIGSLWIRWLIRIDV